MEITINFPYVFTPGSSEVDNAYALRALLECLIACNMAYLRYHSAPPLYESGVVYGRTHIWEPTGALYLPNKHGSRSDGIVWWHPIGVDGGKKRGDCKSLSCALIAQYRMSGKRAEPEFRFNPRADGSGVLDFHILVNLGGDKHEDPSRKLGMGKDELAWFYRS